jgi:hypothetical protein
VDADDLGGDRGHQHPDQHDRQDVRGEPAGPAVPVGQPAQQGPDHGVHDGREHRGEGHDAQHVPRAVAPDDRGHERQHGPGDDVVDSGARQGDRPDRGPVHAPVGQDAGQHRERGDRHRDAQEQGQRERRDRTGGGLVVQRVQHQRQPGAERERHRHRRGRDGPGHPLPAADQPQLQLEADHEHEQHQAQLRQDVQVRQDLGAEQPRLQIAGQPPEQAGAQGDAGDDLPDDGGLADADRHPAEQPGHRDDDGDVDEDERDRVHAGVPLLEGVSGPGGGAQAAMSAAVPAASIAAAVRCVPGTSSCRRIRSSRRR